MMVFPRVREGRGAVPIFGPGRLVTVVGQAALTAAGLFLVAVSGCGSSTALDVAAEGTTLAGTPVGSYGQGGAAGLRGQSGIGGLGAAGRAGSLVEGDGGTGNPGEAGAPPASACGPTPWILSGKVSNARTLGGVRLANGRTVRCSTLYRGPHLAGLTDAGCAELASYGVKTIVDLRTEAERTNLPEAACVLRQATVVTAPLPIPYAVSPADYLTDLHTTSSIAAAFHALSDPAGAPVYFHCTYGRDRTGIVAALVLLTLGATRDEILREYRLSVDGGVGAYPDSLEAVLDEIDTTGGIDAYFVRAGIPASEATALRALAIE